MSHMLHPKNRRNLLAGSTKQSENVVGPSADNLGQPTTLRALLTAPFQAPATKTYKAEKMPGSRRKKAAKKRQKLVKGENAGLTLVEDSAVTSAPNRRKFIKIVGMSTVAAALWREAVAVDGNPGSCSAWATNAHGGTVASGSFDIEGTNYGAAIDPTRVGIGMTSANMQKQNETNWCLYACVISVLHKIQPANRTYCHSATSYTNVQCMLAIATVSSPSNVQNCCNFSKGGAATNPYQCNMAIMYIHLDYIIGQIAGMMVKQCGGPPPWSDLVALCNTSLSNPRPFIFGVWDHTHQSGHCACIWSCDNSPTPGNVYFEDPYYGQNVYLYSDVTGDSSIYGGYGQRWMWTYYTRTPWGS